MTIPASVTAIGAHAFAECDALASVTFANAEIWTVKGVAVAKADLLDAATAAAKVKELSTSEWTWTAPATPAN